MSIKKFSTYIKEGIEIRSYKDFDDWSITPKIGNVIHDPLNLFIDENALYNEVIYKFVDEGFEDYVKHESLLSINYDGSKLVRSYIDDVLERSDDGEFAAITFKFTVEYLNDVRDGIRLTIFDTNLLLTFYNTIRSVNSMLKSDGYLLLPTRITNESRYDFSFILIAKRNNRDIPL